MSSRLLRLLAFLLVFGNTLQIVAQQANTFLCDDRIYQTINVNGDMILYEIKTAPVTFIQLANLSNNGLPGTINSIAYNPVDNYIYGMIPGPPYTLYRIDANYNVTTVGNITGIAGSHPAGCMFVNGDYYVTGGSQTLYRININTLSATYIGNTGVSIFDIAIHPTTGDVYGWETAGRRLVKIDPQTAAIDFAGPSYPDFSLFGGIVFNAQEQIIAYGNDILNPGNQETLVLIDPETGIVTRIGTNISVGINDACSCPFTIDLLKDVSETDVNPGENFIYSFEFNNLTGSVLDSILFSDTLTDGLVWASEPFDVIGMTLNYSSFTNNSNAELVLRDIKLGRSSFSIEVHVPADYCGPPVYLNQAAITNFPAAFGVQILSDFPTTIELDDPTPINIHVPEKCGNGKDDDGDGLTDCEDPDCPPVEVFMEEEICEGEEYLFGGEVISTAGIYIRTEPLFSSGCDSTVELNLVVLPTSESYLSERICEGEIFAISDTTFNQSGQYDIGFQNMFGCDSTLHLDLDVKAIENTYLPVVLCQGETYSLNNNEYDSTGSYSVVLPDFHGCDSIITLDLLVHPVKNTLLSANICEGEVYQFGNDDLSSTGIYARLLSTSNNCDSLVELSLTVLPVTESYLFERICEGDIFSLGAGTFSQTGQYDVLFENHVGCDSTVHLSLDVKPLEHTYLTGILCEGETYDLAGNIFDTTGLYDIVLPDFRGCDSTVHLDLLVHPVRQTWLSESICDGDTYVFGNESLSAEGQYTRTLFTFNNCDSIIELSLKVLPTSTHYIAQSICEGESFSVGNSTFTQNGQYEVGFQNYLGCDSTVYLDLAVKPLEHTYLTSVLCDGENFGIADSIFDASGNYAVILPDYMGCDSTVHLDLLVNPVEQTYLSTAICDGTTYQFGNDILSEAGIYSRTLATINNCDSIIELELGILPTSESFLSANICEMESIDIGGSIFTQTGQYQVGFTNQYGCDSTVHLDLKVKPLEFTPLSVALCEGETFSIATNVFNTTGNYSVILPDYKGCDSTVMLDLLVKPHSFTYLTESICEDEVFHFDGKELSRGGSYKAQYPAANGCDSIVHLDLSILMPVDSHLDIRICDNGSFTYAGQEFRDEGTYPVILETADGCDSTVYIHLSHNPTFYYEYQASICDGEIYWFGDLWYNKTGVYEQTYSSFQSCDSIEVLHLTVNPLPEVSLVAPDTFCLGATASLDAGAHSSYFWSTGSRQRSITINRGGLYAVTVSNSFGCTNTTSVIAPDAIQLLADIDLADPLCYGDHNGYIEIFSNSNGPVAYFLNGELQEGAYISALGAGNYHIQIEDRFGCRYEENILLEDPPLLQVSLGPDITVHLGQQVDLNAQSNQWPLNIFWTPEAELSCINCLQPSVLPLTDLHYQVLVENENGCLATDSINIFVLKPRNVYIPNAFTPDGDGINDFFTVFSSQNVKQVKRLQLFNRWGAKLFDRQEFPTNEPGMGWDGHYNGELLNPAVFAYIAEVEFIDGVVRMFAGDVTLLY